MSDDVSAMDAAQDRHGMLRPDGENGPACQSKTNVAAIFCPIRPALPMPVTIALPLHVYSSLTASQNEEFKPRRDLPNAGRLAAARSPGPHEVVPRLKVCLISSRRAPLGGFLAHRTVFLDCKRISVCTAGTAQRARASVETARAEFKTTQRAAFEPATGIGYAMKSRRLSEFNTLDSRRMSPGSPCVCVIFGCGYLSALTA